MKLLNNAVPVNRQFYFFLRPKKIEIKSAKIKCNRGGKQN
jgi:hypothetical protein